jgi:hypothetical protein
MKKICFLLFFVFILFSGCREVTTQVDGKEIPKGAFSYEAYDKSGNLIIFGWLNLQIASNIVVGDWDLNEVSDGSAPGPYHGTGKLQGSTNGNYININLNPNYMDNNIFLSGQKNGDVIDGTWTYSGYVGNVASGKFHAVKNN